MYVMIVLQVSAISILQDETPRVCQPNVNKILVDATLISSPLNVFLLASALSLQGKPNVLALLVIQDSIVDSALQVLVVILLARLSTIAPSVHMALATQALVHVFAQRTLAVLHAILVPLVSLGTTVLSTAPTVEAQPWFTSK